ncbi:exodeoxyribonuclease V subunit gamma [Azohydromonas aeria]|uniref:exodeoxyribonuclease V subunit gamma n=1 Tax=Azohydromonas aeria TaxID=2590212 RepID=UPI0012F7EB22|nr:exodeoxyribonuclease V subunit gamma [Azohydromonas aeria]
MLSICFSNRFEALQDALLQALDADTGGDPFEPVHLLVPGTAVRRALTLALARAQGVCAHVAFAELSAWLAARSARLPGGGGALAALEPAALAWRVFALLGEAEFVAAQPRLQQWLSHADDTLRWELAQRSAALLARYAHHRPDWLQAWSAHAPAGLGAETPDEGWQAALWRRLRADLGLSGGHPAAPLLRALEALDDDALRAATGLPRELHVFTPAALSPLHLALLQALARRIEVRLYVLNPCREYWFELVDTRRIARLEQQGRALYHEVGQRLLAAWGRQTQAQLDLLIEAATEAEIDDSRFEPAAAPTLLGQLQDAMLELRELAPGSVALADGDRSIELHVAHSRTRELEALHDLLLSLFAADPTLRPSDVLVVTPDLPATAPLVEAVFGTAPAERSIPWAVTGHAAAPAGAPARALLAALALAGSRFNAAAVFELLQQPPVARRFGLDAAALERIRAWMDDAAIRWGLDAGRHSFAEGLSRLYLGYALPAQSLEPFGERLPALADEGGDALALGAFWRFIAVLRRLDAQLSHPMPAAAWRAALLDAADALLAPDAAGQAEDMHALRRALAVLDEPARAASVEAPLSPALVRAALAAQLARCESVPTGRVTFAPMAGLRGLPFRVVCAIGLDDGAFPTAQRPAEFDLMALAPRRGDPQRRLDERNLFLDLVLAARERLVLSCTGRSVRDGSPRPPSVLVTELLDVLVPAVAADASPAALDGARARLVVEHPLQPFASENFDPEGDARLRGFDADMAEALRASLSAPALAAGAPLPAADAGDDDDDAAPGPGPGPGMPGPAFFTAPLPHDPAWRQVSLEQLAEFFRNPCRYLLTRRLGLALPRAAQPLRDEETFLPEGTDRRALAARLLPALESGRDAASLQRLARAGTEYPAGRLGGLLLEREMARLSDYAAAPGAATVATPPLAPFSAVLDIAVAGEAWQLEGACADLRPDGLWRGRYGDARAADHVEAWLWQLWLCAARPPGVAPRVRWRARDTWIGFAEAPQPRRTLAALLALYREGLTRPLRFFPGAAWAFMEGGEQIGKARSAWHGTPLWPGEGDDAAYRLALRGCSDPLDEEFVRTARAVLGPLRECLRGVET